MKKTAFFGLILILLCTVTVVGCSKKAETKDDRLSQIKKRGYIEVATEPYFAPYEFIDPSKSDDSKYVGLDIEIAKKIAEKIGVELRIIPLEFTAVQAGVASGKYDLAISALSYSPTRAEAMKLSNVYEESKTGYGFIIRTEDKGKYNNIEDLANAVVITQSGSVQEGLYNSFVKKCKEFKRTSAMTDAYLAVQNNKADVCICSTDSAGLYAEANGNTLFIPEFRFDIDPNMNGVVVAAPLTDSDSLIELVNGVIKENNANGNIPKWKEQYSAIAKQLGI